MPGNRGDSGERKGDRLPSGGSDRTSGNRDLAGQQAEKRRQETEILKEMSKLLNTAIGTMRQRGGDWNAAHDAIQVGLAYARITGDKSQGEHWFNIAQPLFKSEVKKDPQALKEIEATILTESVSLLETINSKTERT